MLTMLSRGQVLTIRVHISYKANISNSKILSLDFLYICQSVVGKKDIQVGVGNVHDICAERHSSDEYSSAL